MVFSNSAAAHDAAPWVERLARVGFLAKSILYMTVGVLAARAAYGSGGKADGDSRSAMESLLTAPFGRVLMGIIALGLIGYSLWRLADAILDAEGHGSDAKGIALRVKAFVIAVIHLGLAYTAARLALFKVGDAGNSGEESRNWSARALELPGGVYLLWGVAAAFVGYGAYQLYRAFKAKLSKQLELGKMTREAGRWVIGVSRFGIAARGIVFGTVGVLFARAARSENANEAGGLSDSMRELIELGRWPFIVIALGLVAYGVYQALNARYRRIHVG